MSEEKTNWRNREIAACWKKEGGKYTGAIKLKNIDISKLSQDEEIAVIMFPNTNKQSDRSPDYSIYLMSDEYERLKPGSGTSKEASAEAEPAAKEEVPDLLA